MAKNIPSLDCIGGEVVDEIENRKGSFEGRVLKRCYWGGNSFVQEC